MNEPLSEFIKKIARVMHKQYAVKIKGTNSIVVPQVTIGEEEILCLLNKNKELTQFIYELKHMPLLKTSKTPLEDILPKDIVYQIVEYIPCITTQMVTYCMWCLLDNTERQIMEVIHENQFDIMWYDYGSMDYKWARDTIDEANLHLKNVQNNKKGFLKHSRYSTPQPISL